MAAKYTPAERTRRWRLKHPERAKAADARYHASRGRQVSREYHLRKTYGLTREAFAALLAGQDGQCAICRTDAPNSHGWCVDHDHDTGKVRGVLCHSCNVGIGALKDDCRLVDAAAAYLRRAK